MVLGYEGGRQIAVRGEAVRPGSSFLPEPPGLHGGPGPWVRAGGAATGQTGRNCARSAINVLRPGRPVIPGLTSLCLLWRAAPRGTS